MPFGIKDNPQTGNRVDFDIIYSKLLKPAVERTGLECTRGDDTELGGVIHKSLLSLVMHSDVMIADVTTLNANVLYELGIRHATRPSGTLLLFGEGRLPFYLNIVPTKRYQFVNGVLPDDVERDIGIIAAAVKKAVEQPQIVSPIYDLFPSMRVELPKEPCVFIGHGRNRLWLSVQKFLEHDLGVKTVSYESESRIGKPIVMILEEMLGKSTFAVLVLTAEDETSEGHSRARQNVVHEVGLFQGTLGFHKTVLMRQDNVEEFSNIAGLQDIRFHDNEIEKSFYELQRVLKREKVIS